MVELILEVSKKHDGLHTLDDCKLPQSQRGIAAALRMLDSRDVWGNNLLHALVWGSGARGGEGGRKLDMTGDEEVVQAKVDDPYLLEMLAFLLQKEKEIREECFREIGELHRHLLMDSITRPPLRGAAGYDQYGDYQKMTPFVLAAKLGRFKIFKAMMMTSAVFNWAYGPIICRSYPLDGFDGPPKVGYEDERVEELPSALDCLIEEGHVEFFKNSVVKKVVYYNWRAYGKWRFYSRLLLATLVSIALIFLMILQGMLDPDIRTKEMEDDYVPLMIIATSLKVLLLIVSTWKIRVECRQISNTGLSYFMETGAGGLENWLSWLFYLCFVSAVAVDWIGGFEYRSISHALYACCCVFFSCYLFFFFLGFELTGAYVVMVARMIFSDLARFTSAFLTVVVGFATAFMLLFQSKSSIEDYLLTLRDVFLMAVGQIDPTQFEDCHDPVFCTILMCLYIIIVTVLLLNLLIATMSNTYAEELSQARQTWLLERARITSSFKSELDREQRQQTADKYWVDQAPQRRLGKTSASCVRAAAVARDTSTGPDGGVSSLIGAKAQEAGIGQPAGPEPERYLVLVELLVGGDDDEEEPSE
eukprot:NODE_468_length_2063_cov_12.970209_g369_i0.p1 GENE.NODE_468_length_2063_cov_12.970209_g369_i0~~NODE_468_length_2063_cov_12.970209_g369_i0.p1  ORF type:complete len:666 (+),score=206.96 NODE_468_length_2063_cov_12.970209_g369_i0:232-1998(+)